MSNYTIYQMFENPRKGRQARHFNKCSEKSRSQIVFQTDIFQKLSLGAPANSYLGLERTDSIFLRNFWLQAMTKNLNIDEVKVILSKCT